MSSGGTYNITNSMEKVGTSTPDGLYVNTQTDKIGFFGATPITQPAVLADSTDATSTMNLVNALKNNVLEALGLMANK